MSALIDLLSLDCPYPSLETIIEETESDVSGDNCDTVNSSPSSTSTGPWGWGWGSINSDEDSGSVINVVLPQHHHSAELDDGNQILNTTRQILQGQTFPPTITESSAQGSTTSYLCDRNPDRCLCTSTENLRGASVASKINRKCLRNSEPVESYEEGEEENMIGSIESVRDEDFLISATSLPFREDLFADFGIVELPFRKWASLESLRKINTSRSLSRRSASDDTTLTLQQSEDCYAFNDGSTREDFESSASWSCDSSDDEDNCWPSQACSSSQLFPKAGNTRINSYRSYDSLHLLGLEDQCSERKKWLQNQPRYLLSIKENEGSEVRKTGPAENRRDEDVIGDEHEDEEGEDDEKKSSGKISILKTSAEALSEDSGYGDATVLQQPTFQNTKEACSYECPSLASYENNQKCASQDPLPEQVTCEPDATEPSANAHHFHCQQDRAESSATTSQPLKSLLERRNPEQWPVPLNLGNANLSCESPTASCSTSGDSERAIVPSPHDVTHDLWMLRQGLSSEIYAERCGDSYSDASQPSQCACVETACLCNLDESSVIWDTVENEIPADDDQFLSGVAKNSAGVEQQLNPRVRLRKGNRESALHWPQCSDGSGWYTSASHNCADAAENVTLNHDANENTDMDFNAEDNYAPRVPLKRYGPHQEVEVFISKQRSNATPSPIPPTTSATTGTTTVTKGVHFSPIVSTVNWRESYFETESEAGDPQDETQANLGVTHQPSVQVVRVKCDEVRPLRPQKTCVPLNDTQKEERATGSKPSNGQLVDQGNNNVKAPSEQCDSVATKAETSMEKDAKCVPEHKKKAKKEKESIFQRFSLARLSARMSATFSRHNSPSTVKLESISSSENQSKTKKPKEKEKDKRKPKEKHKGKKKAEDSPKSPAKGFFIQKSNQTPEPPTGTAITKPDQSGGTQSLTSLEARLVPAEDAKSTPGNAADLTKQETGEPTHSPTPAKETSHDELTIRPESPKITIPVPAPRSVGKPPLPPQAKPRVVRRNYWVNDKQDDSPSTPVVSNTALQYALEHFRESARQDRERLAKSVQDLAEIDEAARCAARASRATGSTAVITSVPLEGAPARQAAVSRTANVENAWQSTLSKAAQNLSRSNLITSHQSQTGESGLLETNIDDELYETNLDDLIQSLELFSRTYCSSTYPDSHHEDELPSYTPMNEKKCKSMLNLGLTNTAVRLQREDDEDPAVSPRNPDSGRAKSVEFLLEDENKTTVKPPENELMKSGDRQMSEYELRIQRSLQRIAVPEWFKTAQASKSPQEPILRPRDQRSGATRTGWAAYSLKDRTPSMTSVNSSFTSSNPNRATLPSRLRSPDWRSIKSSRESLASPLSVHDTNSRPNGPSTWTETGSQFHRWGSSRSSASPAPSLLSYGSGRGSRPAYLGWRSQEKLHQKGLTVYQSPNDRLALSLKESLGPNGEASSPTAV